MQNSSNQNKSVFSYVTDKSLYVHDTPSSVVEFLRFGQVKPQNDAILKTIEVENNLKNIGRPYSKSYCEPVKQNGETKIE